MDKVVHFEIPVDNVERAKKFYAVFGWNLQDWPMSDGSTYIGVHTTPIDEKTHMPLKPGAINGGMFKRTGDELKTPLITIEVANIDTTLKKVEKSGGKTVKSKTPVADMGFIAYFKDTEGNIVGLWENIKK